jgi:hypothetical protein
MILQTLSPSNLVLLVEGPSRWWIEPEWWLLAVGVITALVIGWQSWETRKAAQATRASVEEVKAQTAILKESVDVSEKSADAAKISADAIQNSERAWLLAHLEWIGEPASPVMVTNTGNYWVSNVALKLVCQNQGKSPAWIDCIHARLSIVSNRSEIVNHESVDCDHFGPMAPTHLRWSKRIRKVLRRVCDRRISRYIRPSTRDHARIHHR